MNKEEVKPISISSKIVNISLINFRVAVVEEELKKTIDNTKFAYEFSLSFNTELISINRLNIISLIKIFTDESKQTYLGDLESMGVFEIENINEIIKEHNGGIPTVILAMFGGILLSTTRGFLLLKSKDTIVDGALLPIVNVQELFNPTLSGGALKESPDSKPKK